MMMDFFLLEYMLKVGILDLSAYVPSFVGGFFGGAVTGSV